MTKSKSNASTYWTALGLMAMAIGVLFNVMIAAHSSRPAVVVVTSTPQPTPELEHVDACAQVAPVVISFSVDGIPYTMYADYMTFFAGEGVVWTWDVFVDGQHMQAFVTDMANCLPVEGR